VGILGPEFPNAVGTEADNEVWARNDRPTKSSRKIKCRPHNKQVDVQRLAEKISHFIRTSLYRFFNLSFDSLNPFARNTISQCNEKNVK
jgi:hypothetical protein